MTDTTIKAIETHWKGYRFRSRLEARWAVFFERLGWKWKYEHQGYEIGWVEDDKIAWLPDFEIEVPRYDSFCEPYSFYVEVKGDPNFFAGDWLDNLDFDGGPPGFADCGGSFPIERYKKVSDAKPLMILGSIPEQKWGRLFVPVVTHRKGISVTWSCVCANEFYVGTAELLFSSFCQKEQVVYLGGGLEDFQPFIIPTTLADSKVMEALDAARAARFEHGEKP